MIWNLSRNIVLSLAATALLTACAPGEEAFKGGQLLIGQGHVEEGLTQLEQAMLQNPDNLEFRTYYVRNKELYVNQLLAQADAAREAKHYGDAEVLYRQILKYDPNSARVAEGLESIRIGQHHDALLAQAQKAFKSGDLETADTDVRQVLNENPKNADAAALKRQIEEKQAANASAGPALGAAFRKPITLEFRDASLRAIFEVISRATNINFIFDRDVRPDLKSTIFVKNTTIEDVINLLMVTNQLDKKVLNDNTVLIYPNTPAKSKDYQDLMVRAFYLANADVKQTLNMIKTLVKTRDVFIDDKLNLLVMKDTPEAIHLAEKLIAAQDRAESEVVLDVEVMEVNRSRLLNLGVQWPNQFTALNLVTQNTQTTTAAGGISFATSAQTQNTVTVDTLRHLTGEQIAISPNLQLNLRKEDGDAQILANPRIRVKNHEKAKIHIGDKVPVITTTTTANVGVSESVNYLDVGLKLDVEPTISLDNEVSMKVGLEVSNIVREIKSANGTLTYQVGTRNASTVLRLKDGETQALAGLISDEDRKSASKVPGLGDLPLLGHLFASHNDQKTKTEIVLLITPHIVRNIVRPEMAAMEFPSGTESSIGAPPLTLRKASPSEAHPATGATSSDKTSLPSATSAEGASKSATREPVASGPQPSAANTASPFVVAFAAPSSVAVGKDFVVTLNASANSGVAEVALDLVYDPSALAVESIQEGALMKQGGARTEFSAQPADGRARITIKRAGPEVRGSGALAIAKFKVLSRTPGTANISIEKLTALDAGGKETTTIVPARQVVTIVP